MDPGPLRDVLTVVVGFLTGVLSGTFGVGGAVVSTPGIRALGASASIAIGSTLPSIIPGAASGTARYLREGLVDKRVVLLTAPIGIVGAVGGSLLSKVVPGNGHVLMLITAGLLGVSAYRIARSGRPAVDAPAETDAELVSDGDDDRPVPTGHALRYAGIGTLAGVMSGLLGVGGGIVLVPGFTQIGGLPLKRAIATSLACVAIFAVPGTITHAWLGDIDWRFALLLAVGVVPGAMVGASLTMRAEDHRLRVVVATFLGVMTVLYGTGELLALFG